MYSVTQDYLDYINDNNNIGRSMRNKIIIDNVEYLSNVIKSNPKISHKATSFIGGFPAKTCEFEILNIDGSLVLNNKEIEVYKGLEIKNSIEWVKMGIFKAKDEDITTNETSKSISFKGTDRSVLFDKPYVSNLDWSTSHTGLEIAQDVCTTLGITLETTSFNFATYTFTERPNFTEDITYREVINRLAEIGGEIAFISRNGGLRIVGQNITNQTVGRGKRESLTKEAQFGAINSVVLGKANIDDDIVYQNQELIEASKSKNLYNYNDLNNFLYTNNNSTKIALIPNGIRVTTTMTGTYKYITCIVGGSEMLGKTYTLSGVFKASGSNNGAIKAYFLRDDGFPVSSIQVFTKSNQSVTFTVPSAFEGTSTKVGLIFYSNDTGTSQVGDYVDYTNVQLEEGSERTNYEPYFNGVIDWKIEDNPYVDLIRESIIEEVASHIIGMSIIPFSMSNFIDDFIYDINDVISVIDNNGNTFNAVILEYETSSRIKSNVAASTQTEPITNHKIAGSTKEQIAKVQLQVNHNTQEISSLATKVEETETNTTQFIQNQDKILMEALKEYVTTGDFDAFKTTLATQFKQTSDSFNFNFNNVTQQINELNGATQEQFHEIQKYIRFIDGNIVLGESGSELTLKIENDRIAFIQNNNEVAYFSNNKLNVTDGEFLNSLVIGNFAFKPRANGNLSLVYIGGDN